MNKKIRSLGKNVSEQYLLSCKNKSVYSACTKFFCMHKILVHAQHSCACTTLLCMRWRGQGPRPWPNKTNTARGRTRGVVFLGPGLGPVVHAQESCACKRILCMHNILFYAYIIIHIAPKHFHTRLRIFSSDRAEGRTGRKDGRTGRTEYRIAYVNIL